MTREECIKGLKYLSLAYGTDGFTQEESGIYYEFLQEYSYDTFRAAVKNIIRKSKFLPKITELLEECENCKEQTKFEVLEFMKVKGYFKESNYSIGEYEKAIRWLERGNIPDWFKKDLNKYYKMMKQETLDHKEILMIGG